jgi:hypothetical protein
VKGVNSHRHARCPIGGNVGAKNEKSTENISAFFYFPDKASLRIARLLIDRLPLPGGRVLFAASAVVASG